MASDLRPGLSAMLDSLGLEATVTRPAPDDSPIETTIIWVAPLPMEVPISGEFQRQEPLRVLAIPLSDVPTVPSGTLIEAPEEQGLASRTWKSEGEARREYDHVRVVVVPVSD
jgi:hypothetical protein